MNMSVQMNRCGNRRYRAAMVLAGVLVVLSGKVACAGEPWQAALARMPLTIPTTQLDRTNVARVLLEAFKADPEVKGLVMMPGCTDEFYFFRRATVRLTNAAPTLMDAVAAMTNQTHVRATFRRPLLLLHTSEDPVEPAVKVEDSALVERLKAQRFQKHILSNDMDWNALHPILCKRISSFVTGLPTFLPPPHTPDSWHFFRHSFAAWNLTAWEALEAISLAGKTVFTVRKRQIFFEGDTRSGTSPQ
jgi:hypothetical protein